MANELFDPTDDIDPDEVTRETVSAVWDRFAGACFPGHDAPPDQLREMRRAFYAGAWFGLTTFGRMADVPLDPAGAVEHLGALLDECERFRDDVLKGRA